VLSPDLFFKGVRLGPGKNTAKYIDLWEGFLVDHAHMNVDVKPMNVT